MHTECLSTKIKYQKNLIIQEILIEYNAMGATGYYTRVLSRYGHAILFAPVTFPRSVKFRHS